MDDLSLRIQRIRRKWGFWTAGILSNKSANVAFSLSSFDRSRREPIAFTPLLYNGRPYLAGVQGMRKSTTYEAIRGWVYRTTKEREDVGVAWRFGYDKMVRQIKKQESREY